MDGGGKDSSRGLGVLGGSGVCGYNAGQAEKAGPDDGGHAPPGVADGLGRDRLAFDARGLGLGLPRARQLVAGLRIQGAVSDPPLGGLGEVADIGLDRGLQVIAPLAGPDDAPLAREAPDMPLGNAQPRRELARRHVARVPH